MARKITTEAIDAFMNDKPFHKSNMDVNSYATHTDLLLHGNQIAIKEGYKIHITSAGWRTNTTKERLNAIPGVSISQKKGVWYLNGIQWDGSLIEIK